MTMHVHLTIVYKEGPCIFYFVLPHCCRRPATTSPHKNLKKFLLIQEYYLANSLSPASTAISDISCGNALRVGLLIQSRDWFQPRNRRFSSCSQPLTITTSH